MRLQPGSYVLAGVVTAVLVAPLIARAETPATHHTGTGPTVESALAAEEELARAMRENDADGIARMLSDDWAVINARGGVAEGKDIFPEGIRTGRLLRKTYEISEPNIWWKALRRDGACERRVLMEGRALESNSDARDFHPAEAGELKGAASGEQ